MSDGFHDARSRVLACLKAAGPTGVTTWDLIHQSHHSRAVGRVLELQASHVIDKQHEGKRVYRWVYKGEKQSPSLLQLMEGA